MEFNWIDACVALLLVWGAARGFYKGFVLSVSSLIGLILGIYIAAIYSPSFIPSLKDWFVLTKTQAHVLSFVLVFIVISVGCFFIAKILDKFLKIVLLSWINRLVGVIFGLIKYALILSVLFNLYDAFIGPNITGDESTINKSVTYRQIQKFVPTVLPYIEFYTKDLH